MKMIMLILMASCLAASARLGESNVDILNRYGAVQGRTELGTNIWRGTYLFKEYNISVIFFTNTAVAEIVTPIEQRKFSDDERDALMKSIGGSDGWIKDTSDVEFMANNWINTANKNHTVVVDKIYGPSTLMVISPVCVGWWNDQQKAKDKAKADGF